MRTATYYHASARPIQRSAGRSAVACAAYRTGSAMEDERYGTVRDYSHKGDVVTSFTLAPKGAPEWAFDAQLLWNEVERKENRIHSQLATDWTVALPNELDASDREHIARNIASWLVDEYGVAVTCGIHEGTERGNGLKDHLHAMMTQRAITEEGWAKNKLRDFSTQPGKANPAITKVREKIAEYINAELEAAGSEDRVTHLSFKARGIEDQEPSVHLGPAATWMEHKNASSSDRAELNRAIMEERLAWQQELAVPEITDALDKEFSARWDDWQPLARGVEMDEHPPLAAGTPADTSEHHSGWRIFADRVRAFQSRAVEFLHDETSGGPELSRGFAARIFDAGRKLIEGWHHHNGREFSEGLEDAVTITEELRAKPQSSECDAQPKSFADRVLDQAKDLLSNQRGSFPDDKFDRAAEEWAQSAPPLEDTKQPPPQEPDIRAPDGPDIE